MKIVFLLVWSTLILNCSLIRKEHISQPKIEIETSIKNWLKSANLLDSGFVILTLKPDFFFNFDLSSKIKFAPLIYPSKSKNIFIYNGCTTEVCMDSLRTFTKNINPLTLVNAYITKDSMIQIKKGLSFEKTPYESFADYFRTVIGDKYILQKNDDLDYYLILPFTKFFGKKKQIQDLKLFLASARSNTNSKFKVILLNMDKQEWWGNEWNDKIDFSIKAL